ncbi:hypothetical protein [Bacillus sp. SM2101]|uniref:YncE family protein n=1 Tax=Bacillus sp. SM2101 TaxID=2805366 RepID=UPI001BDF3156
MTNNNDGTVSVIDVKIHSVITTIQVGSDPFVIAFTPDGKLAYVTHFTSSGTVSVIDVKAHSVIATVPIGSSAMRVNHFKRWLLEVLLESSLDTIPTDKKQIL